MANKSSSGRSSARIVAILALPLAMSAVLGCGKFPINFGAQKEEEIDQKQLAGTWVAWHSTRTEVIDLREDGTFHFMLVGDSAADFSGKWVVNGRDLELKVGKFVKGDREKVGNQVKWKIEKLEANELVLSGLDADTTYIRQQTKTAGVAAPK